MHEHAFRGVLTSGLQAFARIATAVATLKAAVPLAAAATTAVSIGGPF
jgi:hypothetical protein